MDTTYKVLEIFASIDGEGKRTGELTTFIRLSGCNLRCDYCDTKYSNSGEEGELITLEDILRKVNNIGFKNITLTGGEPLFHENVEKLLKALSDRNYDVNVETNGSIDISNYLTDEYKNVWFTIDYKSKSSKMNACMIRNNYRKLRKQDVLKFVCANKDDLLDTLDIVDIVRENFLEPYIYYSPVFNALNPEDIVNFMKENNLQNKIRVQVQLHKVIWDPDKRGV